MVAMDECIGRKYAAGVENVENGKNEMVSTRRFAAFLTNEWSCRACGTRLASKSNCEVCAEAVNWECRQLWKD